MTVNELVVLVESIKTKWQNNVVQARPSEQGQLQAQLGKGVSYELVGKQFQEWMDALKRLASKPRVSASISKPHGQATAQCLAGISHALDHAGNGIDWICNHKNFAVNYSLAGVLVRELSLDSAREANALVDAAKERIEKDLADIQVGSELAKFLSDKKPDINEQVEAVKQASEKATLDMDAFSLKVEEGNEKIDELLVDATEIAAEKKASLVESISEFESILSAGQQKVADATSLKERAQSFVEAAATAQLLAEAKRVEAEAALDAATQVQIATNQRLTKALQSAQMEGLAGSFTKSALDTATEIGKEQSRFERALLYLALVAVLGLIFEMSVGLPKTTEEFVFRVVRALSLAAPGIWIAWAAARRLGALNRVYSDYQYKSASALAYESYRQTVADAGDDELKKQLLAFAIRAFGENPTRYYDLSASEPNTPGESWIGKIFSLGKPSPNKTEQ
jgi:hypothetical protein